MKKEKKSINSVEVVDKSDRPIMTMDLKEVHRQSLRHRSVVVLVYDSEGKLYLQKRSSSKSLYSGRWDASAGGHVLAGESRLDAAFRELKTELGLSAINLKMVDQIEASAETGYEFLTVYFIEKVNSIPNINPEEVDSGYYYSESELSWLVRDYRDILAPALVFLHDHEVLFNFKPFL